MLTGCRETEFLCCGPRRIHTKTSCRRPVLFPLGGTVNHPVRRIVSNSTEKQETADTSVFLRFKQALLPPGPGVTADLLC